MARRKSKKSQKTTEGTGPSTSTSVPVVPPDSVSTTETQTESPTDVLATNLNRLSLSTNPNIVPDGISVTDAQTSGETVPEVVQQWDKYFGKGELKDWQRLCQDLGLKGDFGSKTKCRKALNQVNINICDFLQAENKQNVEHFERVAALSKYSRKNEKIYPKKHAKKKGPVRALLKNFSNNKSG